MAHTRFRPTLAGVQRANARFSTLRQRISDQRKISGISQPGTPGGSQGNLVREGHSTTSAPSTLSAPALHDYL